MHVRNTTLLSAQRAFVQILTISDALPLQMEQVITLKALKNPPLMPMAHGLATLITVGR